MLLSFLRLQVELTRRCNQACAHCCRGEAQNLDLTPELIDAFFENNSIYSIGTLLFSGGEPTLNGEMLDYFVDKIIQKQIPVGLFMLGINGLSYSEAMVRGLNKLQDYIFANSNYKKRCAGALMISQDQFHQEANPEVVKALQGLSYLSPIEKTVTSLEHLLPYGRAYQNHLSTQTPNLDSLLLSSKCYHIKEYEGKTYLVISYQYLSANGNVVLDGCQSYDLMDNYAIGNIQNQSIETMYLSGKSRALVNHPLQNRKDFL